MNDRKLVKVLVTVLATAVVRVGWLPSGSGADSAAAPDPIEILRKVDAATRAVKAVAYTAEVRSTATSGSDIRLNGKVKAREVPGATLHKMNIRGDFVGRSSFHVISDGQSVLSLDHSAKVATHGKLPGASRLLGVALGLWMQEFLHPTPFADELEGDEARHEGTRKVGGVECDVIYVVYSRNRGRSRWYFGRQDHLPRRVDRLTRDGKGARVLTVTELDVHPEFDAATFSPDLPGGYEAREYQPPPQPQRPELLAVGSEAPPWSLETPGGETVSLERLRGKVVVLDFWATWCGPCRRAMPAIQKVHEKFKGQPVEILGVNCFERGKPAEFMKENGFTYGLLLKGDKVAEAYRVSGIPTFYVIGPDGKIFHRAVGFDPALEASLEKIIESALPKKKRKTRRF